MRITAGLDFSLRARSSLRVGAYFVAVVVPSTKEKKYRQGISLMVINIIAAHMPAVDFSKSWIETIRPRYDPVLMYASRHVDSLRAGCF
nr:hypothetical protein CFP56_44412 [Quercus suber]